MKFSEIIGNQDAKEYLIKSINEKHILHSYLFLGTEGIGKLLIAKEFAKKILCLEDSEDNCTCKSCICFNGNNNPDFSLINESGDNIKIDTIRDLTSKIIEKPIVSNRKVYIINDFEKMTKEAQNCLLKTLEEPPEFVTIILISSNENIITNTIKSRCMTIKFKNIENNILYNYLINNYKYGEISDNLLKSFDGSLGKALKLYDNKDKYNQIDLLIDSLNKNDLIDIMQKAKIIYEKDSIFDILDYIIVCLYSKSFENERFINCIKYVNKCINRLKANSNFDMSIDNMVISIWEELNENSNRC